MQNRLTQMLSNTVSKTKQKNNPVWLFTFQQDTDFKSARTLLEYF